MSRSRHRHPTRHDGPAWFAPKRIGYGSGLPVAWQGWVLLVVFVALVAALAPLAARSVLIYLSLTTTMTAVFLLIVRKTTPGGWRWRSGKDDDQ